MNRIWQFGLFVWLGLVIVAAFLWAPLAKGLGEYTRVLYFHVPVAWVTVLAFLIGAVYSIVYLRKREIIYDQIAEAASQLGLVFCILATVTGSIWAKVSWGSFWNWDPRETSIFILLLIYVEQEERKATLAAVYAVMAFVTVPFFVFIVPRVYSSLHPDPLINTQARIKMDGRMLMTFLSSLFGFSVLFIWMLVRQIQLIRVKLRLREMEL